MQRWNVFCNSTVELNFDTLMIWVKWKVQRGTSLQLLIKVLSWYWFTYITLTVYNFIWLFIYSWKNPKIIWFIFEFLKCLINITSALTYFDCFILLVFHLKDFQSYLIYLLHLVNVVVNVRCPFLSLDKIIIINKNIKSTVECILSIPWTNTYMHKISGDFCL